MAKHQSAAVTPPAVPSAPAPPGPAQDFERFLENSTETELNQWAVRMFGGERYKAVVWLVKELRRLRADVTELRATRRR